MINAVIQMYIYNRLKTHERKSHPWYPFIQVKNSNKKDVIQETGNY